MSVLIDGELVLYGFVGDDFWDDGFTASEVIDALAMLGHDADITVRINSGGGYTSDGVAIYNALKAHRGDVAVVIDAIAASAASVIAMAGDNITMREGALMMIHDPAACTCGDARDHEKSSEILNKLGDLMADIYAGQCGEDAHEIREDMQGELWLTGEEAVQRGFATDTEASEVRAVAVAAFDYRLYAHAPKKLAKMARKNNWSFKANKRRQRRSAKMTKASTATPCPEGGKAAVAQANPKAKATDDTAVDPDTDQANDATDATATGAADAKARIKAILEDAAAGGNEPLARHLAFETDMPASQAIAALKAAATGAGTSDNEPVADADRYQAQRSGAAALAQPVEGQKDGSTVSVLTASVDRLNKRR